jgi:dUTP pyrophosphatase
MNVRFKRLHPDAVIPTYAHPGQDAGADLVAVSEESYSDRVVYNTGLAIEIPKGYVGLLFPRSSNVKKDLLLGNSVGVVDHGYTGPISFVFKKTRPDAITYGVGQRVGQMVILPIPYVSYVEADELAVTERGNGSYGSTGV